MKINEPSAAFKLLGGHIVLHLALLTSFLITRYAPSISKYSCAHKDGAYVVAVLIISHGVSAVVSMVFEISGQKGYYSLQAFCEIVRIPTYFYVIIYAGYKLLGLLTDDDIGCVDGHLPLQKTLIAIELGIFAFWIFSTPVFLACSKILGYDNNEEAMVH